MENKKVLISPAVNQAGKGCLDGNLKLSKFSPWSIIWSFCKIDTLKSAWKKLRVSISAIGLFITYTALPLPQWDTTWKVYVSIGLILLVIGDIIRYVLCDLARAYASEKNEKEIAVQQVEIERTKIFKLENKDSASIEEILFIVNFCDYSRNKKLDDLDNVNLDFLHNFADKLCQWFKSQGHDGSNYSVSIKLKKSGNKKRGQSRNKIQFENVVRDRNSIEDRTRNNEEYMRIEHTVSGNTAYNAIYKAIESKQADCYYINQDVESDTGYYSTSKQCYENGRLPYKSELVYPIMPYNHIRENNDSVLGMLCITCDKPNGFKESERQNHTILMLVEHLYNLLWEWKAEKKVPSKI